MNKFIVRLIFFSLITLCISLPLWCFLHEVYLVAYESVSLESRNHILCDSRGLAIQDDLQEYGWHNFSFASDSYVDMERKMKFLIRQNSADTIAVTVDGHCLSSYREVMNNNDRSIIYSNVSDESSWLKYVEMRYLRYFFVFANLKVRDILYSKIMRTLMRKISADDHIDPPTTDGENWMDLAQQVRHRKGRNKVIRQYEGQDRSEVLLASLKNMIAMAEAEGVVLVGVKFPLSPEYLLYGDSLDLGAANIFKEHGLRVVDLSKWAVSCPDLMKDPDHLTREGGREFAHVLIGEIRKH